MRTLNSGKRRDREGEGVRYGKSGRAPHRGRVKEAAGEISRERRRQAKKT